MDRYENWRELLATSFDQFVTTLSTYLPSLLGALLLIITGLITAWSSHWLITHLGKSIDHLVKRLGIGTRYFHLRWPVSKILAGVVYWLIILFFITAAAESMKLPGLADWLGRFMLYLPSILIAAVIIWIGFALGAMARDKITVIGEQLNISNIEILAGIVRTIVIILTVVIGLTQIGVDVRLVEYFLVVLFTALTFSLALAFGLGAGPVVNNIIAIRNLRRQYRVGQRVRIKQVEGEILELSKTSVILDTESGRAMVPATTFQEEASILLDEKQS